MKSFLFMLKSHRIITTSGLDVKMNFTRDAHLVLLRMRRRNWESISEFTRFKRYRGVYSIFMPAHLWKYLFLKSGDHNRIASKNAFIYFEDSIGCVVIESDFGSILPIHKDDVAEIAKFRRKIREDILSDHRV